MTQRKRDTAAERGVVWLPMPRLMQINGWLAETISGTPIFESFSIESAAAAKRKAHALLPRGPSISKYALSATVTMLRHAAERGKK